MTGKYPGLQLQPLSKHHDVLQCMTCEFTQPMQKRTWVGVGFGQAKWEVADPAACLINGDKSVRQAQKIPAA